MNRDWSNKNKQMQSLLKKNTFQEGIKELLDLRNVLMEEILSWKQTNINAESLINRAFDRCFFWIYPWICP